VLLLGDVSFLHDVGSLKCVSELAPRLTLMVLNNRGGRLFEQLPIAHGGSDLAPWLTPQEFDLSGIARAFSISSRRVSAADELRTALNDAAASDAPALVEVLVPPSGTAAAYRSLVEQVRRTLANGRP